VPGSAKGTQADTGGDGDWALSGRLREIACAATGNSACGQLRLGSAICPPTASPRQLPSRRTAGSRPRAHLVTTRSRSATHRFYRARRTRPRTVLPALPTDCVTTNRAIRARKRAFSVGCQKRLRGWRYEPSAIAKICLIRRYLHDGRAVSRRLQQSHDGVPGRARSAPAPLIRSERTGFLLCGIADEALCSAAKASDSSLASMRWPFLRSSTVR
jgi:hypothetical protein